MNQLICGPLAARRALHPRHRLPNSTEISDRRQGHGGAFGTYKYAIMDRRKTKTNAAELSLSKGVFTSIVYNHKRKSRVK